MEKKTSYVGMTFATALGLAFIVMKLVGTISWSWWWVTAPLWGVYAIAIVAVLAVFCYTFIAVNLKRKTKK